MTGLKVDPITMTSHRLVLKVFAEGGSDVNASVLVPVFHGFIQTNAIEDHLLIDVADYDHVHHGPGTLLVSHEANFGMDRGGGRLGLRGLVLCVGRQRIFGDSDPRGLDA